MGASKGHSLGRVLGFSCINLGPPGLGNWSYRLNNLIYRFFFKPLKISHTPKRGLLSSLPNRGHPPPHTVRGMGGDLV